MSLKLWGRPTSARTQKVMLALAELRMDYEYILASSTMGPSGSVAKGSKPFGVVDTPEYLAMNPTGTIPTIDDDGYILWESNAVVQYLGMRYDPVLFYRNDIKVCNSAARWMMWENNRLIPPMHELVEHLVRLPKNQSNPVKIDESRSALVKEFIILENQLSKTRFIAANEWTMADIPIVIRCHRFYLLDIDRPKMPNLLRYYKTAQDRHSFEIIADAALHVKG